MSETKDKEVLVCANCGGNNITTLAWIDSNTNEYKDDYYDDKHHCDDCEDEVEVMTMKEYFEKEESEIDSLLDEIADNIEDADISQRAKDYLSSKIPPMWIVKEELPKYKEEE